MGDSVLAESPGCDKKQVADIVKDHWKKYGRNYYSRHDYVNIDSKRAEELMENLRARLDSLSGKRFVTYVIDRADEFSYTDPVDPGPFPEDRVSGFSLRMAHVLFSGFPEPERSGQPFGCISTGMKKTCSIWKCKRHWEN